MKRSGLFDALIKTDSQLQPRSRNRWILLVSVALAVLFLYLALRNLDWSSFFITLRYARYELLPILLLWSSLSYLVRALRWRVLLSVERPISWSDAFWANMSGYLGNSVLPARLGELVRAAYANRTAGLSVSFALASGLSERLMDVFALVLLGTASLSVLGISSGVFQRATQLMAIVALFGGLVFLLLPIFSPWLERIIRLVPFLNPNIRNQLLAFLAKFIFGLRALLNLPRAVAFGLGTVLIWLMDGLGVVLLSFLLHVPIGLTVAFVLLAGLGLSSAIPSTPGYVGVYQFVAVTVLGPFGVEAAVALALILFSQVSNWIVVGCWGLVALWRLSRNTAVTN